MYESYFGMKQRPFDSTPRLGGCYPAAVQEEALATLRYAITQGRGIGLLTGPPGTGKTLVCRRLTAGLEPEFTTAMITNTNMATIKALLQAILYDLSLPYRGLDEQELRLTLTDFLLGKHAGGGRTVLIIDEAQNLAPPLLEELRMLGNLEGESDKLFQIVLAGQPRLLSLLRAPELETLNQRIGARAMLTVLSDEETIAYVRHQLQCAGVVPDELFTYEAMTAVYEATAGIPRLINQLCDHALLLAYVAESRRVEAQVVEQASADLNRFADPESSDPLPTSKTSPSVAPIEHYEPGKTEPAEEHTQEPDAAKAEGGRRKAEWQGSRGAGEQGRGGERESGRAGEGESGSGERQTMQQGATHHSPLTTHYSPLTTDHSPLTPTTAADAPTAMETVEAGAIATNTWHPAAEQFAQEEIIVDPYAMMDAARQGGGKERRAGETIENPTVSGEGTGTPSTPAPTFVEPSDNPAVHEVGAGLDDETVEGMSPPILVIESRSRRAAGNLARVDVPQPAPVGSARTYRRLFTHARKS